MELEAPVEQKEDGKLGCKMIRPVFCTSCSGLPKSAAPTFQLQACISTPGRWWLPCHGINIPSNLVSA